MYASKIPVDTDINSLQRRQRELELKNWSGVLGTQISIVSPELPRTPRIRCCAGTNSNLAFRVKAYRLDRNSENKEVIVEQ